jgi:hypothetical protein
MTTITVTKDESGKLVGFTEKDKRAYGRFRKMVEELGPGELAELQAWFPRNPKLHRLHFGFLGAVYNAQEFFLSPDDFRAWATIGAGFVSYVPAKDGGVIAIPASLSYRSLDDEQFADVHERTKTFIRSEYARKTLWTHLSNEASWEMVETMIEPFEAER